MRQEGWHHFSQKGKKLAKDFNKESIEDKVTWLTSGSAVTIF